MEKLTRKEIQILLEALRDKYGPGYAKDLEVNHLQAKLSIWGEIRDRLAEYNKP